MQDETPTVEPDETEPVEPDENGDEPGDDETTEGEPQEPGLEFPAGSVPASEDEPE